MKHRIVLETLCKCKREYETTNEPPIYREIRIPILTKVPSFAGLPHMALTLEEKASECAKANGFLERIFEQDTKPEVKEDEVIWTYVETRK